MVSRLPWNSQNESQRYYQGGNTTFFTFKMHEKGPILGPKSKKMEKKVQNFEPRAQPKFKKWTFGRFCRWRIGFYF